MLSIYRHMFTIPDLRKKIFFTLSMFAVYRLGVAIPIPGVDLEALALFQEQQTRGGVYGLLNLFSGGALEQLSVFSLGILPYITASIIMQLLTVVIPRLQALQEEGEAGRKVITQWTRYMTVLLALIQSTGIIYLMRVGQLTGGIQVVPRDIETWKYALMVLTMTAGTAFIMWLGELITQRGIGNGMSLLIFISILSQFPFVMGQVWASTVAAGRILRFVVVVAIFLFMVVAIIYVDQAQRRIPISFAKRVRGRRVMGGQSTYIPIKVNTAGVIPVIFASSFLAFPSILVTSIPSDNRIVQALYNWVDQNLGASGRTSWWYIILLFVLILFFTYFYTAIQFDPVRQSEMIQRQGGFVPGVRPGSATARHLSHILSRITLPGAIFLGVIAVMPALAGLVWAIPISFGGTSILILVGVALETMKQIESQLTLRNYEGILT